MNNDLDEAIEYYVIPMNESKVTKSILLIYLG